MKRKRKQQPPSLIDKSLLSVRQVPQEIIHAEKVTEALLGKKLSDRSKLSVRIKTAIKNYKKAVTRKKLADTLLKKHHSEMVRCLKKADQLLK